MFLKEKNIYNKYFFNYLIKKYYNIDYEYALIILLKNKKFFYEKIHSIGDINSASIYSREIINLVFEKKANGFILIHNHPSGDYAPSKSDIAITNNLFTISSYLGLNFFDSLIVGKTNVYSVLQKKYWMFIMNDLNDFLLKLSNDFGFDHVACWNIKNKEPLTTYPLEWTQHYIEQKLNDFDHTLINHLKKPHPFVWGNSLINRLNENKKKVFIEAKRFDLNSGFSIPVIGENGIKSIVNFASKEKQKHIEKKVFHIYDKFIISNLINNLSEKNIIKTN